MKLIAMIDELLRNRAALYQQAREGKGLRTLSLRLLLVFLITTAIYGAVMGTYRSIHPAFFLSDFELTTPKGETVRGAVAGMTPDHGVVYTQTKLPVAEPGSTVRFNLTNPSDAYPVSEIGTEKGYEKIVLAPGSMLAESNGWLLPILVALKIPLLFLLTLGVCALALYILNLAVGLQLHFLPSMTLMLFALAGTGVMLVVFAPITLLFAVVTASYHFMKILHVLVFIIAGIFGVKILGEGLSSMQPPRNDDGPSDTPAGKPASAFGEHLQAQSPIPVPPPYAEVRHPDATSRKVRLVVFFWLLLYSLVGAQMAWTLKPFLGTPYLPATPPFRLEQGNIFVSTMASFQGMRPSNDENNR